MAPGPLRTEITYCSRVINDEMQMASKKVGRKGGAKKTNDSYAQARDSSLGRWGRMGQPVT